MPSDELMQKRSSVANNRRKVIFLHDNARLHVAKSVNLFTFIFEWKIFPHIAYSPDLVPSDYHLFRSIQDALTDTHFSSYEEIQKWIDEWIASKDTAFYDGVAVLSERWEKVIKNGANLIKIFIHFSFEINQF